jgi:protein-arginine kinase
MNDKEWMQRWSDLRMAAVTGLIDASIGEIDHLMMDMQPASLNARAGKTLSERERGTARTDLLREKMAEMPDALIEI